MKQITAILIGAGQRGAQVYGAYALKNPQEVKIVAVAEPNPERRAEVQAAHNIPLEYCLSDWNKLLNMKKFADCVMVCTQDNKHFKPAIKALQQGYHILMEKPMSSDINELLLLGKLVAENNRIMSVCHVLRYTPFFSKVKEVIQSGAIGEVMSIQQIENVAYWHQAHSFVRGNWRKSDETSPMILAKSCHDMDILLWLADSHCTKVSSFGALSHFKKEKAPKDAPLYCMDGCKHANTCPYNAEKIYLKDDGVHVPVIRKVVSLDDTDESVRKALERGPYGRCVYHCDNDVVDHQIVNLEFENEITASFTMCAFTAEGSRTIKIMGTMGQIKGDVEENYIEVTRFIDNCTQRYNFDVSPSGHSGGDVGFMKDFVKQINSDGAYKGRTNASKSVESHLIALACEKSRLDGKVVLMNTFIK